MLRIKAIKQLFRIELPLAAGVCTLIGAIISAGKLPPLWILLSVFLCVFFISSSAMISNDYFDLETDRINAPDRPLPSGHAHPKDAILFAILTAILGLAAAAWMGLAALVVALVLWTTGLAYNWKGKATGLIGNLMVSACIGMVFIFGAIAVGEPWNPVTWTLGSLAFCFDLGEEIAADATDVEGDRLRGSNSLAIMKGRRAALSISGLLFGLVILISLLPVIFNWLGTLYLFLLLIMDGYIIFCSLKIIRSQTAQAGRCWVRWNYQGVSFCQLAFLLARMVIR
ncbi:MAG: UbiA family prenyltransferase [Anaerolineales bacterium]|jgi:geranylgeranylglycerol-phosphate geranylgeranyltransferase